MKIQKRKLRKIAKDFKRLGFETVIEEDSPFHLSVYGRGFQKKIRILQVATPKSSEIEKIKAVIEEQALLSPEDWIFEIWVYLPDSIIPIILSYYRERWTQTVQF